MPISDGSSMSDASALAGLRVVDLSRILAGPYCTQLLADYGAEVVKVESPNGDDSRSFGPPFVRENLSAYYAGVNRGKRNIVLDLEKPGARGVLLRLLANADVVVENFRVGVMSRWGLDYDSVLAVRFPRLIYCRITGFGVGGPLDGVPGYDAVAQAYSGLMSVNGEPDRDPLRVGVPVADLVTGIYAFSGILLALQARGRDGRGQLVDCSLLNSALTLLHPHSASWFETGAVPRRTSVAHPNIAPYETFRTATGSIFIAAANDRQFAALVDILGKPDMASDPRFLQNSDRVVNIAELRRLLSQLLAREDITRLAANLRERGIPAAPIQTIADALNSEQVAHQNMVVSMDQYRGIGVPIKLGRSPAAIRRPPGDSNSDGQQILLELGYSEEEISELDGVAETPPGQQAPGEITGLLDPLRDSDGGQPNRGSGVFELSDHSGRRAGHCEARQHTAARGLND
jgi:crotonobetainyl-CoA:carnitine CoA-transferase CaiB-like acyl-CoA transferase